MIAVSERNEKQQRKRTYRVEIAFGFEVTLARGTVMVSRRLSIVLV
jgi:hypothetical protein